MIQTISISDLLLFDEASLKDKFLIIDEADTVIGSTCFTKVISSESTTKYIVIPFFLKQAKFSVFLSGTVSTVNKKVTSITWNPNEHGVVTIPSLRLT